jgi:hypothetical protein
LRQGRQCGGHCELRSSRNSIHHPASHESKFTPSHKPHASLTSCCHSFGGHWYSRRLHRRPRWRRRIVQRRIYGETPIRGVSSAKTYLTRANIIGGMSS